MKAAPRKEYERRLKERKAEEDKLDAGYSRISSLRLIVFIAAAAAAWISIHYHLFSVWWLLVPVSAFIVLVIQHGNIVLNLKRVRRSIDFYMQGIARLDDQWDSHGEQGDRFIDASHPYTTDLDIFGKSSLFQLLCRARTHAGEDKLAGWMKSPAGMEEIKSRQSAVLELCPNLDLREDLAVLGPDMNAGVKPEPLIQWAKNDQILPGRFIQVAGAFISALTFASIIIWFSCSQPLWLILMILVELGFNFMLRRSVRPVVLGVEKACSQLKLLSLVLARLEKEQFKTVHLNRLRQNLDSDGMPPSCLISRLDRLMGLLESRKNQLFMPFAFILLWEIQLAFFIESWRTKHGNNIEVWLDAAAEIEALSSLAGYTYENPEDPFPEFTEQSPCFKGEGLGHPMLPGSRCVRNDVCFEHETCVFVVSGSNMSGKSTLLRTVGINAVLAMMGAPVRAKSLKLSLMNIGASIRTMDSLKEGTSRFYAEIKRLKQLVTLAAGPEPLLFLLDELLHGTNSQDRLAGGGAIIKGLIDLGAIGIVTTHDLALAQIEDAMIKKVVNVHFVDHIKDGEIIFDYILRSGVVKKSNAIALMRSIGLEV